MMRGIALSIKTNYGYVIKNLRGYYLNSKTFEFVDISDATKRKEEFVGELF